MSRHAGERAGLGTSQAGTTAAQPARKWESTHEHDSGEPGVGTRASRLSSSPCGARGPLSRYGLSYLAGLQSAWGGAPNAGCPVDADDSLGCLRAAESAR